jgi:hypothetical protein
MTHEEMADLYELFVLGVLEPEEATEMESHLARHCPECQAGMRRAWALSALVGGTFPERVDPPKRLRRRVLASVGAEPKGGRLWLGALAALTACLLVGVIVLGLESERRAQELADVRTQLRQRTGDLTKLQTAMRILDEPETEQVVFGKGQPVPPRGRIFVNSQRGVLLLASHLPAAPSGKLYELWLLPKTGAPIPAGLFQADDQGNAFYLRNEPVDLAGTKALAVTLEPQAGSTTPTMPIVFSAGLGGS